MKVCKFYIPFSTHKFLFNKCSTRQSFATFKVAVNNNLRYKFCFFRQVSTETGSQNMETADRTSIANSYIRWSYAKKLNVIIEDASYHAL